MEFLRDIELPGLEIRHAWSVAHAFPRHSHPTYSIGLMERVGAWCANQGDENTFVRPGELALFNPGQVHTGIPPRDTNPTYHMFYLDEAAMAELARDVSGGVPGLPEFTRMVVRDAEAWKLLYGLMDLIRTGSTALEKQTVLVHALGRILDAHGRVRANPRRLGREPGAVARAMEILEADLADKLSLSELAEHAGLSRYHLIRVFKRATGLSPHAWRTQRRIEQGKVLLRTGVSIADVAQQTGFTDQSHFTNTFKRLVGATPAMYRGG